MIVNILGILCVLYLLFLGIFCVLYLFSAGRVSNTCSWQGEVLQW
jgi:hypothetical protein